MAEYILELDEPWTFLDKNKKPVQGRRLTYELGDGTIVHVNVTMSEYRSPESVKAKLTEAVEAHKAILAL